jgi:hypothetical protein
MPLIYGEGKEHAVERLREEIAKLEDRRHKGIQRRSSIPPPIRTIISLN